MFELFDPRAEYSIRHGNLPHWYQAGVTYFITFRTEDSVPQSLIRSWYRWRDDWLRRHGLEPAQKEWRIKLRALSELEHEYNAIFTRRFMDYMDRGCGACVLRNHEARRIVADSLRHFDGARYHLGDFVIMPNHVHLLVCLIGASEIEAQCASWKRYSAG